MKLLFDRFIYKHVCMTGDRIQAEKDLSVCMNQAIHTPLALRDVLENFLGQLAADQKGALMLNPTELMNLSP